MHSKRIVQIQKRAKRRLIALAVVAAVIAGYSSCSLFAVEEPASQSPIAKVMSKPGVRAVGIRLIHPNGATQATGNASAPNVQSAQQLPRPALPPMTATLPLPAPMPPLPASNGSSRDVPQLPPAPSFYNAPSLPVPGFSLLPAPPRMSDVATKSPAGKVVMKLGSGNDNGSAISATKQSATIAVAESVDGELVQSRPIGQPAKMPPFLVDKSAQKVTAVNAHSGSNSVQSAVRVSIADSSPDSNAVTTQDQSTSSLLPQKNRMPQLVKSKPTQLGHTVVLAQSTDFDEPASSGQAEEFVPPVEVDASLVPNAITSGAVVSNHQSGVNATPGGMAKAVVSDAVEDAFISFVPPAVERGTNARIAGDEKTDSNGSALQMDKVEVSQVVDSMRRKFDSRMMGQSPNATVELECLTATSMDLAGKMTALAVLDENVCKVLHNGRTVSLVGNQEGTTYVQIWTSDLGDKPQVIRVNVSQQRGKVQATRNEVKDIKQVIAQGFPRADVNIVSKEDGSIEVRGTTESEESAKRILDLVRKLYLVPVKDKITVSN